MSKIVLNYETKIDKMDHCATALDGNRFPKWYCSKKTRNLYVLGREAAIYRLAY